MLTPFASLTALARLAGVLVLLSLAGPLVGRPLAARAGGGSDLTGVVWQWQGTVTGAEPVIPDDPARYTVAFRSDGTVAVRADCNRVTGSYAVAGNELTLISGPAATTLAVCPPDSLDQEFLRQLRLAAVYRSAGTRLFIGLRADLGTMLFIAAPTD